LLLGGVAAIAMCLIGILGYFVVYKKICKGKKTISPFKISVVAVFICYLTVIAGAVFLSRAWEYDYRVINLQPLSLYREAWFTSTAVAWRNLILNIAAFIPFGIMLPLLSKKLQRLWKTVGIGFAFTVIIESVQFITGKGQASADDIINNTFGVLIGYGLIMAVLTIINRTKRNPLKLLGYLAPLLSAVIVFIAIFAVYQAQEFGNMPSGYYTKQDMNSVEISCKTELSDDSPLIYVYHVESLNKKQSRVFAEQFFKQIGSTISIDRDPVIYDESAYYYSSGGGILNVRYKGKTYSYTNFSSDAEADKSLNETQARGLISNYGIDIPAYAKFTNHGDGQYSFDIGVVSADQQFAGNLSCKILKDGTIRDINNNLLELNFVTERNIISS